MDGKIEATCIMSCLQATDFIERHYLRSTTEVTIWYVSAAEQVSTQPEMKFHGIMAV